MKGDDTTEYPGRLAASSESGPDPVDPHARNSSRTTVIVPTYNRAEFLGEALASLLDQTLAPSRIVVIDDGSTDDTKAVVESFGPHLEYRHQANSGKANALNSVLSTVTEEFVWIFDDDDVAEPDALAQMVRALSNRLDCGFAYGAFDTFRSTPVGTPRSYVRGPIPDVEPESLFAALLELCFVFQGGLLVRRSAYDEVGPFDERLVRSQDYEMMLRLARRFSGVRIDPILFHQRQHGGRRGTAAAPIAARRLNAALRDYDLKIFLPLFRTLDITEYGSASEERFVHLARRAVIFARKDLWDEATQGLIDYFKETKRLAKRNLTPAEVSIFRSSFDLFSRGDLRRSRPFQEVLRDAQPKRLRGEIRAAMLHPLNFRIRRAVLSRNLKDFMLYTTTFALLCCRISLTLHASSTLSGKFSTEAPSLATRSPMKRRMASRHRTEN